MSNSPRRPIHLCKTGIEGFDDILNGGLPRDRLYLIMGDPGVGKTTLAMQFLIEGAKGGETVLYITLSETADELHEVAASHGWDLSGVRLFELSALEDQIKESSDTTFFSPAEVELHRTTRILLEEIERVRPSRIVLDSLSELRLLSETALRYRRQILHLKQYFVGRKCTVLMLDDNSTTGGLDEQVESLAHGVIRLTRTAPDYGVTRRQISVQKIRGVRFREGHHDLLLRTGGMTVFPRLVAAEHRREFPEESLLSGIANLDRLMGGGIDRGTSTILMGPAGTGKSTLAMSFAVAAAQHGERALFFTFDEVIRTLMKRSRGVGLPVDALVGDDKIRVQQIDPAEISPGELAYMIKEEVQKSNVRMVVIDSLNGYMHAMPDERHLILQLHELLSFLNQQGVSTLMVLTQQGLVGTMQSPLDLTYLADSVVLLRYFEAAGTVRQAISIIKKRSGNHERSIREIEIGPGGVKVGEALTNFRGILTGSPVPIPL